MYKLHRLYFTLFAFLLFTALLGLIFVGWPGLSTWLVDFSLAALFFYMGFSARKDPGRVRGFGRVLQIVLFLCFFFCVVRWTSGTGFEEEDFRTWVEESETGEEVIRDPGNRLSLSQATALWLALYQLKTGLLVLSLLIDFVLREDKRS